MKNTLYKLFILFTISIFMFACSQDESETIYAPIQQDSFLNGDWKGVANEEQKSLNLDVTMKENYGSVSGSGTVKFLESNDISNITKEFTASFNQGILNKSQISFIIYSPADSDYVSYNGGLDKNDSAKFLGSAVYYLASEHRSISFTMILNKQ